MEARRKCIYVRCYVISLNPWMRKLEVPLKIGNDLQDCAVSTQSKLVQAIMLLTCIQEVSDSNPSQSTNYHDWGFYGFSRFIQVNVRIVLKIRPCLLPALSFLVHYSLSVMWGYIVWVLAVTINVVSHPRKQWYWLCLLQFEKCQGV